jgi:lipoprotein-anchoring transpeptidase ErfK/SrfK
VNRSGQKWLRGTAVAGLAVAGLAIAGLAIAGLGAPSLPNLGLPNLGHASRALPAEGGYGHAVAAPAAAALVAPAGPPPASLVAPGGPPLAILVAPGGPALASVAALSARVAPARPALIATLDEATSYSAGPGQPPIGTLPATDPFGAAEVLAVVGQPDAAGWMQVELPIRPNGSRGWIRTAGVRMSETSYRVLIDRQAGTVTVTDGGRLVLATAAAVGRPATPTPAGETYLWELIRPDDPTGAYGPYIFGLAMFSDAYSVFNGGDAQIGLHGQDQPGLVGHPVSHGCVRVANDVISHLAAILPLGTPVTIV